MKNSKSVFGWVMYDFANSAFVTVIVTVVYSVYFRNVVVNQGELGTALWGRAISISMLLVAISSPILGAVADYSRSKKKLLFINCYLTVIFTGLLYFVEAGDIRQGMIFFIIANYGFNSGNVFYNALLPEIASRDNMGKISGLGWGVGYMGGLLSLVMVLPLVHNNLTRWVFPTISLFFGIFAIFTFILLREVRRPSKRSNYLKIAYHRLSNTVANIRDFKELIKFIISYLIYNDGIIIVISFGAIYGSTRFGMDQKELIIYFIIANLTSIIGSFSFGFITDKLGAKKTIMSTLLIWVGVVLAAFFSQTTQQYYLVGMLAGIAIGASQSSSRTMLALLTPDSKMAEFFGFYSVTGRIASIIGPLVYGEVARITGDQKWAILSVLIFFAVGFLMLATVDEAKGRATAINWSKDSL